MATTITETPRPKVLIVGAGLGGLTLGVLLEKAGVPYAIYERSIAINPIGSAIALGSAVMPMFKQLGLHDQLVAMAKPYTRNRLYNAQGRLVMHLDYGTGIEERFDSQGLLFSRPSLHQLILDQIPKDKIHFSKKMTVYDETENGVDLQFSDGSSVKGNILVGADGANSGVRQYMYQKLAQMDALPAADKLPLKYSSIALVGQTRVLDPAMFPLMHTTEWICEGVLGDNQPYITAVFPSAQNTLCWMVVQFLDKEENKFEETVRESEWGPGAAEEMASREDVRRFRFPGLNMATMGDLIDWTPKELISKVMLEEKIFETWTHGRAILVGDACHKMTPAGGQGAVNSIIDALVLSNYIETLRGDNLEEIKQVFKSFKEERFARTKAAVDASAVVAITNKSGWASDLFRAFLHNAPRWLWNAIVAKTGDYRPQAAFLPLHEDKGTVTPTYQPSLHLEKSTRRGAAV